MKIKKTSLHNGHSITSESQTKSAKALNAEYFEQTKSAVSKEKSSISSKKKKEKKTIFLNVSSASKESGVR